MTARALALAESRERQRLAKEAEARASLDRLVEIKTVVGTSLRQTRVDQGESKSFSSTPMDKIRVSSDGRELVLSRFATKTWETFWMTVLLEWAEKTHIIRMEGDMSQLYPLDAVAEIVSMNQEPISSQLLMLSYLVPEMGIRLMKPTDIPLQGNVNKTSDTVQLVFSRSNPSLCLAQPVDSSTIRIIDPIRAQWKSSWQDTQLNTSVTQLNLRYWPLARLSIETGDSFAIRVSDGLAERWCMPVEFAEIKTPGIRSFLYMSSDTSRESVTPIRIEQQGRFSEWVVWSPFWNKNDEQYLVWNIGKMGRVLVGGVPPLAPCSMLG